MDSVSHLVLPRQTPISIGVVLALVVAFVWSELGVGGCIKPGVRITKPWNLVLGDHCWLGEDLGLIILPAIGIMFVFLRGLSRTGNRYRRVNFNLLLGQITVSQSWIAAKAVIGPGTHVGQAAVVGLGAVASGEIPAGAIVRGNPAVVVSHR